MFSSRRNFLHKLFVFTLSSLPFGIHQVLANIIRDQKKFDDNKYPQLIKQLYKNEQIVNSKHISFSKLPDIAENGAAVPITISTTIDKVNKISIFVENNPRPLIAEFYLSPLLSPRVSARLKMAKDSQVIAIVEADGKLYKKSQFVKVTVGGCG